MFVTRMVRILLVFVLFSVFFFTSTGCHIIGLGSEDEVPATSVGNVTGVISHSGSNNVVTGLRTAKPVGNAVAFDAEVWLEELPEKRTRTKADGTFLLEGIPVGEYHLIARFGAEPNTFKMRSAQTIVVVQATAATMNLTLQPSSVTVGGVLYDADGNTLAAGTKLRLWGEEFEVKAGGLFQTPPLPEGFELNEIQVILGSSQIPVTFTVLFVPGRSPVWFELCLPFTALGQGAGRYHHPPCVSLSAQDGQNQTTQVGAGRQLTITATVTDSGDRDRVTPSWNATRGTLTPTADPLVQTWTAPVDGGIATVSVRVVDGQGASALVQLPLTVEGMISLAKSISMFGFTQPAVTATIDQETRRILATVPFGTDVKTLVAQFTASTNAVVKVGSSTQVSGSTSNDFSSPVTFIVTSQSGAAQEYVVTVTIASNTAKAITAFSFALANNPGIGLTDNVTATIDQAANTVAVTVPFGTTVTGMKPTFTISTGAALKIGSTVQVSGSTISDFSSPVTFVVTSQSGAAQEYIVTVTIGPNTAKAITAFSFALADNPGIGLTDNVTATIDQAAKTVVTTVPFGTTVTGMKPTFTISTGATLRIGSTVQVSGSTSNDSSSPVTFVVTSQSGAAQEYVVTVTIAPNTAKAITAFSFALADNGGAGLSSDVTGTVDESGKKISLVVPGGVVVSALKATFSLSTNATAKIGGSAQVSGATANDFGRPLSYTITAQDGSVTAYAVTVTREWKTTGSAFSYVVPAGLTSIQVIAWGADGGQSMSAFGGRGCKVTSTVAVTPGETLTIRVGGKGGDGFGGAGGWNGGGSGTGATPGTGGGGATDLSLGATPLVVAGAGGGAGCEFTCMVQGLNGGHGGENGGAGAMGGQGGTQIAAGNGGAGVTTSGSPGSGSTGGSGGPSAGVAEGGGGGGGGYFGGGGGGVRVNLNFFGNGTLYDISGGGGGGFSYGPAGTVYTFYPFDAANSGHGRLTIVPLN